jgi:hypothetical protein
VERKWKNYIITFPGQLISKNIGNVQDASAEIRLSGGKLLPHSDLRGGVSLEETSSSTHYRKTGKDPHQY